MRFIGVETGSIWFPSWPWMSGSGGVAKNNLADLTQQFELVFVHGPVCRGPVVISIVGFCRCCACVVCSFSGIHLYQIKSIQIQWLVVCVLIFIWCMMGTFCPQIKVVGVQK